MIFSLACPCLASEVLKTKSTKLLTINPSALRFENLNSTNIDIYYNNNILNKEKILQFFLDARPLIKTDFYPTNFKLKIYKFIDGKQIVLKVLNKNIKIAKSAEKSIFLTDLNLVSNQEDLYLDLYDTNDNLYGSYKIAVNFQNQTEAIVNNTENIDCDLNEPDCLLKFIFEKVNFSASFDNKLITEVTRLESGNYSVIIPVKKGRKLTDKVKNFDFTSEDGGKTNGKGNSNSGYYPYFNNNKDEVASSTWNEDDSSVSFSTASLENVFQIFSNNTVAIRSKIKQGLLNIGASSEGRPNIVFEPGSLNTSLIDGALEYDGSQLYFTSNGSRIALGSGSGAGIPGPAGPTGPQGPAGTAIDLSNGGFLNGVINFTNNGIIQNAFLNGSLQYIDGNQAAGRVLTSDALGNATWQVAPSGGASSNGTLGAIQLANGSGGFNADSSNFYWNNTNDYAVIGNATLNETAIGINAAANNTGFYVNAIGASAAANNTGSDVNALGYAAINNTGIGVNALGNGTAWSNTGSYVNAMGESAALNNTGDHINALGFEAAMNNTGYMVNAFGLSAAQNNTGAEVNALGQLAASQNTGLYINAFGFETAYINTGDSVNALGSGTAFNNTGSFVNAIGSETGYNNRGQHVNMLGTNTAYNNKGDHVQAIGTDSLYNNNGDYNIALGYRAGYNTRNGSENIMIGRGADVANPNLNKQINIGNTIYGGNGRLALGIVKPLAAATLELNGSFLYRDGNQAVGRVLTSDALGNASWQVAPSGGASSSGTLGAIQLADGSGGFNSDSSNFYIDIMNGYAILGDSSNSVTAIGYQAATNNSQEHVNAIGSFSASNNSGEHVNAIGRNAAFNNSGDHVNAIGTDSAYNNQGSFVNAFGHEAASLNTASSINAFGYRSGYQNTGDSINAFGYEAAGQNLGENINAVGNYSAHNNTANDVNAFGSEAARNNSASTVNAFGNEAARENTGSLSNVFGQSAAHYNAGNYVNAYGNDAAVRNNGNYINAFGHSAAFLNNGDHINAFGYQTLAHNNGDYNIAIGYQAGYNSRNGSGNIMIGRNADVANPNLNKQINIGNTIYGGNGRLAIGIVKPLAAATLELNGSFLYRDGNQAAGRVLTTDALGNATWQVAPSGGDTNGQVFVVINNVISNNGSSADYQDDFVIGSPSLADTGIAANDSRMFFDKSKGAFRAGSANSNQWNDANVGNYSVAFGTGNIASGSSSIAWGTDNTAGTDYSTVWGENNTASGDYSTSWGSNNIAAGDHSTTWGTANLANNTYSTVWGQSNIANGNYSTAWGDSTLASGLRSTAWGFQSVASFDNATAWGDNTIASSEDATAWGFNTIASGFISTAWGSDSIASGDYSTAWGFHSTANGNHSTAFGQYINSGGNNSITFGRGNSILNRLTNTINNSLMIGFNSNAATLFVGPSAGGSTTGNVGIGTSSPARKLHISEAMRLEPQASPPAGPSTGDLYVDSDGLQALCIYLNGAWVVAAGSGTCS